MKFLHLLALLITLATSLAVGPAAWAVEPDEMLKNPVLEARARALSKELRCMVCQNESIDESGAPLAHDLRVLVRQRILAGDSDAQIINFLVSRYGEFVLLKPRLSWHTAVLWGTPPAILLIGAVVVFIVLRRRGAASPLAPAAKLTPAEEARLAEILRGETTA